MPGLGKPPSNCHHVKAGLNTHGIDLARIDGFAQLEACPIARNAIAQGLGRITAWP